MTSSFEQAITTGSGQIRITVSSEHWRSFGVVLRIYLTGEPCLLATLIRADRLPRRPPRTPWRAHPNPPPQGGEGVKQLPSPEGRRE